MPTSHLTARTACREFPAIFCVSGVITYTTMRFLWYKLRDSIGSLNALSSRKSSVGNSSYAEGFNYTVIEPNYSICMMSDTFNDKCLSLSFEVKITEVGENDKYGSV